MEEKLKDKVLRLSDGLVVYAYRETLKFPKFEQFALGDQLRRALVSVPANIIEGYARGSNRELRPFLNIAFGSLAEVKYLMGFAFRQGYIAEKFSREFLDMAEELSKLLWILICAVRKSSNTKLPNRQTAQLSN